MIDILIEKYKVDESRIFVTGWSNGGYMTYRLACELSEKIAGAAPFAGFFGQKKSAECVGAKIEYGDVKGNVEYAWDTEKCPYEFWRDELPEIYSCEQAKEVPLLII